MDELQLRQAIIKNPREDAPRLAYAAWCDAQGDKPRGDYIRAAVARSPLDPSSPQAQQLFQEEMRALAARPKGADWRPGFSAIDARYKTKIGASRSVLVYDDVRGFTGSISARLPDILAVLDELCAVEPIEQLGLQWEGGTGERESPGDPAKLALMPQLLNIQSIYLPADVQLLRALGDSAFTVNIQRLRIGRPEWEKRPLDGPAFLAALLEGLSHGFAGVRQLEISGVNLDSPGVERLCATKSARTWQRLALERADLRDAGAKTLAAAATFENLQALWLRENGITADGLAAIVNSPALAGVRDLDLGKNAIDEPGMNAIAERKSMQSLARLGLEESVHHRVYADWTDWTGANIGGDYATQIMEPRAVADKYTLPGVSIYTLRHQ